MDDYACSCGCLRRLRVERSLPDSPRRTGRSAVDGMERHCDAARTRGHPESGAAGELECSRVRACAKAKQKPGHSLFRSEEHRSELPSLMRSSYTGYCLKKKNN